MGHEENEIMPCPHERIGVEVQGVYDGVLFWVCPSCMTWQHRWPAGDTRRLRAEQYISANNLGGYTKRPDPVSEAGSGHGGRGRGTAPTVERS
jgi:hypothetical protein